MSISISMPYIPIVLVLPIFGFTLKKNRMSKGKEIKKNSLLFLTREEEGVFLGSQFRCRQIDKDTSYGNIFKL